MPATKRKRPTAKPKVTKATKSKKTTTASKRAAKAAVKAKKRDPSPASSKEEISEKERKASNEVPVDEKLPGSSDYTVVLYKGTPLNGHLTLADCFHNNNKFYLIQGLRKGNRYFLWTRWGRVGVDGQTSLKPVGGGHESYSVPIIYKAFNSKKQAKIKKGYTEIEISYDDEEEAKENLKKTKGRKKKPKSKLPKQVQDLMKFIFDMKQIEKSVVKVGYDSKKLPLGKLSKETIKNGYNALKKLEKELSRKNPNPVILSNFSSLFYRFIPHNFEFQHMSKFVIDTMEKLKEKQSLVEALREIQVTAEITKSSENDEELNALDAKYKRLDCELTPVKKNSKEWKTLMQVVDPKIDCNWGRNYVTHVLDVFKVSRKGEAKKFKKKIGNRKLLWHGSTFSNWGGILSQGLRIAPPEAPSSGYGYGKGIYFADLMDMSAGYTRHQMSNRIGLLTLADVALGNPFMAKVFDSSLSKKTLPKGTHSTYYHGGLQASKTQKLDGADLQLGPFVRRDPKGFGCMSQFVIYDTDQCQMKYLFKCGF